MTDSDLSPGTRVRWLMRRAETASLSTALARDASGWPYGSLVLVALDHDGSPILLLSDLADHSANIGQDPRVCLLFDGTRGWRDPLAGPRASVLGRAERTSDSIHRGRFLARHTGAQVYIDFKDFHLYRVTIERAHLVAGFGAIHWLEAADVLLSVTDGAPLREAEADIVAHMNQDHGDAVDAIAQALGCQGSGWQMIAIDPEGCDLRREDETARFAFDQVISDAPSARKVLAEATRRARNKTKGAA
ncbi:MAG: DUF2470 domain-containing protein [Pseudomonadota bacterium]